MLETYRTGQNCKINFLYMITSINWIALIIAIILGTIIHIIAFGNSKLLPNKPKLNQQDYPWILAAYAILGFVFNVMMIKAENQSCMADGLKFGLLTGLGILVPVLFLQGKFSGKNSNEMFVENGIYVLILAAMGSVIGYMG